MGRSGVVILRAVLALAAFLALAALARAGLLIVLVKDRGDEVLAHGRGLVQRRLVLASDENLHVAIFVVALQLDRGACLVLNVVDMRASAAQDLRTEHEVWVKTFQIYGHIRGDFRPAASRLALAAFPALLVILLALPFAFALAIFPFSSSS